MAIQLLEMNDVAFLAAASAANEGLTDFGDDEFREPLRVLIAAKDPSVYNWLDTGGLRQGSMLCRWRALPTSRTSATGAVKSVKVVKLSELRQALPIGVSFVAPKERAKMQQQRVRDYARRYGEPEHH